MKISLTNMLAVTGLLAATVWAQVPGPVAPPPPPRITPETPATVAPTPPAPTAPVVAAPAPAVGPTIEVTAERNNNTSIVVSTNQNSKNLISIQFDHAPLTEVIRAFTLISGANLVLGTNGH
ncbi:MAG: hypothetical protein NTY53_21835, partial [Kiritimatiellaeota bacterium]|nr:hypothetical protein [Kiritimatiellota bacterium]